MPDYKIVFADIQRILNWEPFMAFVWPDEGKFTGAGRWQFNEAHGGDLPNPEFYTEDTEEGPRPKFEPLFIDRTTAGMLKSIYSAFQKETSREKFIRMLAKDRGSFAYLIEWGWSCVQKSKA